jgi:hypothetical protein
MQELCQQIPMKEVNESIFRLDQDMQRILRTYRLTNSKNKLMLPIQLKGQKKALECRIISILKILKHQLGITVRYLINQQMNLMEQCLDMITREQINRQRITVMTKKLSIAQCMESVHRTCLNIKNKALMLNM